MEEILKGCKKKQKRDKMSTQLKGHCYLLFYIHYKVLQFMINIWWSNGP